MTRIWAGMLLSVLAMAGLSGCYVVSPYAYPAYPPPAYPPPAYAPPAYVPPPPGAQPAPPPPAPSRPSSATPGPPPPGAAPGAGAGSGTNCQTVIIEGHYETRTRQGGQPETIWVPTHDEWMCQ